MYIYCSKALISLPGQFFFPKPLNIKYRRETVWERAAFCIETESESDVLQTNQLLWLKHVQHSQPQHFPDLYPKTLPASHEATTGNRDTGRGMRGADRKKAARRKLWGECRKRNKNNESGEEKQQQRKRRWGRKWALLTPPCSLGSHRPNPTTRLHFLCWRTQHSQSLQCEASQNWGGGGFFVVCCF